MKNKDTNLDKVQSVEFSTEEKIQTAIDFAPRFFLVCAVSYVVQYVKLTLLTMKLALVIIPLFFARWLDVWIYLVIPQATEPLQDARRFIGGLIFLVEVKNGWC